MTTLFVVFAVVGFGMLLAGFVFDDFLDGALDAIDVDGAGFLSVPVVGAFLGAAGVGGLVVGSVTDDSPVASSLGALGGGIVLGYAAFRLSRAFIDMPTDPSLRSQDYMGQIGRVVTPISGGRGEVMVRVGGSPQKLTARSDDDIAHGAQVVVIEVLSTSAVRVIPLSEIVEEPSS